MIRILFSSLYLLLISCISFGQTFTSTQSGSWENGATWGNNSPGQNGVDYPSNDDHVVISANTIVTQSSQERPMRVKIEANGELISNNRLRMRGAYINDGVNSGSGDVRMEGVNDTISGTGVISVDVFRVDEKRRIIPESDLLRINGDIRCPNNDTLLNFGTLTIEGGLEGVNSTTFFNGPNAVFKVSGEVLNNGTFHASSIGNQVHYTQKGASEQIIKKAFQGYYDLIIDGDNINGLKTLEVDESVRNDLMILNSTLTFNGADSITIAGDLINTNGWMESETSKVKLAGSGTQFIQGRFDFYDLTVDNSGVGVSLVSDTTIISGPS